MDIGVIHDTMIMSQVLYTGTRAAMNRKFSHSLASCVNRELRLDMDKGQQTSDWSALVLTDEQLRYAAYDAHVLPRLAAKLLNRLQYAGLMDTYELELRVSHAIDAMQSHGVAIHTEALDEMIEEAAEQAARLKQELTEEWGINPGSNKQLRELFRLDEREDWPQTEGKAPSTNQDAMKLLVDEHPEVKKCVQWKEVEKIRSTYGESLKKKLTEEGRIHARFNPFGTATGRFSSSSPNLQNIPKRGTFGKRMRGLFWSGSDDRVLIKADYASIELWLAAVRLRDPYMQDALQQGVNMLVGRRPRRCSTSSRGRSLRSRIRTRITSALPA